MSPNMSPECWKCNRNRDCCPPQEGAGQKTNLTPRQPPICLSCGRSHLRASCKFRNAICLNCQRKGHLARVCQAGRTFPQRPQFTANFQRQVEDCYTCYHSDHTSKDSNKISIFVFLEGKPTNRVHSNASTSNLALVWPLVFFSPSWKGSFKGSQA
uniref:CCHC-type domain-containing protein n=1 Tax=Pseudonaja textilis TaxID=8673 RepID=A0A670XVE8_PSETE